MAQLHNMHSVVRLSSETLKRLISQASPRFAKLTHSETGKGGSRRMIESRPSIFRTQDVTECYDRSSRCTVLFPECSLSVRPARPNPNNMPEAKSFKRSGT